jgi:hypothetical protein
MKGEGRSQDRMDEVATEGSSGGFNRSRLITPAGKQREEKSSPSREEGERMESNKKVGPK